MEKEYKMMKNDLSITNSVDPLSMEDKKKILSSKDIEYKGNFSDDESALDDKTNVQFCLEWNKIYLKKVCKGIINMIR